MSSKHEPSTPTTIQPLTRDEWREYFIRAFQVVSALADDGISHTDAEDPQDICFELAGRLGLDDEDYDVNAVVRAIMSNFP